MVSVVSTIETGHQDVIHDAQMDQFGLKLATCSSDSSVRVYDMNTKEFIAELRGHEGPVWQLAWAHPSFGSLLASCSYDQKVILWQESGGKWNKLYEMKAHDASVNSVCWCPPENGATLAAGSSDGSISLLRSTSTVAGASGISSTAWEVTKIDGAHNFGCNAVTWASALAKKRDGVIRRFASGGNDNCVKIWAETAENVWKEEAKLEHHSDWVRDVAWEPFNGLAMNVIASCSQDCTVIIWTEDWTSGKPGDWTPKVLPKFGDVLWHVSWSLTGGILAVSGGDNKVSLWKEDAEENWFEISNSNATGKKKKDASDSPPVPAV